MNAHASTSMTSRVPGVVRTAPRRVRAALFGAVALFVGAACGDDTGSPADTSLGSTTTTASVVVPTSEPAVTTTTLAPGDRLAAVVEAVASGDPDRIVAQVALVAPDSPAAAYLGHQLDLARLVPDSTTSAVSSITSVAGTVVLCRATGDCTRFDRPEATNGLMSTFTVEGVPVGDRLAGPGATVEIDGVAARVLSAYRSPSGGLSVVAVVTNASSEVLTPFAFAAVHRPRTRVEGAAALGEAIAAVAPERIEPDRAGRMLLVFPDAAVDGEVIMTVIRGASTDLRLTIGLVAP